MPVPQYRAPKDSQPWGLLGAIGRFLSPPGYTPSGPIAQAASRSAAAQTAGGFNLGRPAAAAEVGPSPIQGDPTGRYAPGFMQRPFAAPPAPQLPPPTGRRGYLGGGTTPVLRSDDDQYRQLLSQYGGLTKAGKQEEAEKLGMEIWQKKYGKTAMAQPGGAVGAFNPLMQKSFGYQKGASVAEPSYAGSQVQPLGSEDFAVAANAVPAPWNTQGNQVSAPFSGVVPFQAAKTTGEGQMPAFLTTSQKAEEFLRNAKLSNLF